MGIVKKKGYWWIDFRFQGRRRRKKMPDKATAIKVWAKIQTEIAEKKYLDIKQLKRIKFGQFVDKFFDNYCRIRHKSVETTSAGQIKILKEYFGNYYLHEIGTIEINQYITQRLQSVTPATINRSLSQLRSSFNRAIEWDDFNGKNPISSKLFLKEKERFPRYLEKEDIKKLINNCDGILKPIIIVALNTGMRRGEIFNLKWHDIDFNAGLIYLMETKSGKRREIPMNEYVRNTLISVRKHPQSPYVFTRDNGVRVKDVRKPFWKALKRAGIDSKFRLHDTRHTFASQLVMSGVDIVTVKELLGHADLKTTMIYSHLTNGHKRRAVDVLCQTMDVFKSNRSNSIDEGAKVEVTA